MRSKVKQSPGIGGLAGVSGGLPCGRQEPGLFFFKMEGLKQREEGSVKARAISLSDGKPGMVVPQRDVF